MLSDDTVHGPNLLSSSCPLRAKLVPDKHINIINQKGLITNGPILKATCTLACFLMVFHMGQIEFIVVLVV